MRQTTDHAETWTSDFGPPRIIGWSGRGYPIFSVSGAEGEDTVTGGSGEDTTPGGTGDDTTPGATGGDDKKPDEKTLTQEQVNAIVAREVSKATRGKVDPKDVGFESRKDLEDAIEAGKKVAEDQKSETQRQVDEAVKQAIEKTKSEIMTPANQRVLHAEFIVNAKDAGVQHLADAYVLAQQLESWENVKVDDQGKVEGLNEDFFKGLKEAKPFLFSSKEGSEGGEGDEDTGDIGAGAGGGGSTSKEDQKLISQYSGLQHLAPGPTQK